MGSAPLEQPFPSAMRAADTGPAPTTAALEIRGAFHCAPRARVSVAATALALVGILAQGVVALFEDADIELALLLALLLAALEPAAEDLQEGGASSEGGDPPVTTRSTSSLMREAREATYTPELAPDKTPRPTPGKGAIIP